MNVCITWVAGALVASGLAAVAGACTPSTPGIQGFPCSSDGDCDPGLKCLPYEGFKDGGSGAGCISSGKECLAPCHTDSDCKGAAAGLVCFTSCGTAACEAPGYMGVPLVETFEGGTDALGESGD